MVCKLIGVTVLILTALCPAVHSGRDGEEPIVLISDLSEMPILYNHDELFRKLGFSTRLSSLIENVGYDLAATEDKDKPNVLANKYSINDLLARNEVYESDLTPEKVQERHDFCESLSPYKVAKRPESDHILRLIEANKYLKGRRYASNNDEAQKPQEFAVYKNLHDYCKWMFGHFILAVREFFKLDRELDKKLMKLSNGIGLVYWDNLGKYPGFVMGENPESVERLLADFISTKQPTEVAEIKAICLELLNQVAFIAKQVGERLEAPPVRYITVYRYCKSRALTGDQ